MTADIPHEVVILAGGLGTRLLPAVADRPKPMAEVAHRPFITRLLDQISGWGIRSAVLSVGYKAEDFQDVLGQRYRALQLRYAREFTPLGTAGAVRNALDSCDGDHLLVMNGDSYCDIDGIALMRAHLQSGACATMALLNVAQASRYGIVELGDADIVTRFTGRGGGEGAPALINAGIYVFQRRVIGELPRGERISLEEEVFPRLVGAGLHGWRAGTVRFIDIGTPESYSAAQTFFDVNGTSPR